MTGTRARRARAASTAMRSAMARAWRSGFLGGIVRATALQRTYRGYTRGESNRQTKGAGHVREAVRRWSLVFHLERGPARRLRTLWRGDVGRRDDRPGDGPLAGLRLRDGDHRGGRKGHFLAQRDLARRPHDPRGQGDS